MLMHTNYTNTIIILHGWGSSAEAWQKPKALLEEAGYSVFVPDLPGFGKEPAPEKAWEVSDYADWVLDKFGKFDQFVLIGHSFGGRIAIKLAAQHPEKIEKLILTGAAGIRFISFKEKFKVGVYELVCQAGAWFFFIPPLTLFRPLVRKILYWLAGTKDYYKATDPVIKKTFKMVIAEDLTVFLKEIKAPTLLIWGKKDFMIPLKHAELMRKNILSSELKVIKEAGHQLPYQRPEIFTEEVVKFIK